MRKVGPPRVQQSTAHSPQSLRLVNKTTAVKREWNPIIQNIEFLFFRLALHIRRITLCHAMMESALFSQQWENFIFILLYDSKIIVMWVYFDDIFMVYILSMDIFHLHILEMITREWLPFKVIKVIFYLSVCLFCLNWAHIAGKAILSMPTIIPVLRPLGTSAVN